MNLKHFLSFCALSIALLLSSCSTLPPVATAKLHRLSWKQRQQQLQLLQSWLLTGSVAINYRGKSSVANISWRNSPSKFNAIISAPLALSSLQISGTGQIFTLTNSKGQQTTTTDPSNFMRHEFGWTVPLFSFKYWVKGLPHAMVSYSNSKLDNYNHLIFMQQQGWNIYYSNFTVVNNIDLPTKIVLVNNAHQLWIKLVIREWQL